MYAAETWTLTQADRSRPLKCGSGEGWRKSVGRTRRQMRNLPVVQEDRKILNAIWYHKHKWMGRVLWHDGILHDVLEGRMLGKSTRGRRRIQLVDDLLETKNYADLNKAAEDRVSGRQ